MNWMLEAGATGRSLPSNLEPRATPPLRQVPLRAVATSRRLERRRSLESGVLLVLSEKQYYLKSAVCLRERTSKNCEEEVTF